MKYVYVLTSADVDMYYEQCLMSVFSLRHYMDTAEIVILVDNKTYASLKDKRAEIKKYASDIISVDFADDVSYVERSRVLKTKIPSYVHGDFLYIDCDTIVCDTLEGVESCAANVAGVLDGHVTLKEHKHKDYFFRRSKRLGFKGTDRSSIYINGGILFVRDCKESRAFFEKWNELWNYSYKVKKDYHDQSALNEAIYQLGLKDPVISGEWNCQLSQGGLAFLKQAKIIHYFSSEFGGKNYISYYKLADKDVMERIKKCGFIPDDVKQMILDPKFQFTKVHLINDRRVVAILQSPLLFTLADIKDKIPFLFNMMEKTAFAARSVAKKLKSI